MCKKEVRFVDIKKFQIHEHIYADLPGQNLEKFYPLKINDTLNNIDDKIKWGLAVLAGKEGMSFQQIASDNLWEFIYICMDKMNGGKKTTDATDPRTTISQPSRRFVSEVVHEEAEKLNKNIQNEVYNNEYVSLQFDGGNFKGREFYIGMIYSTYNQNCSPHLVCFEESIKTQQEMAKVIGEVISKVWRFADITNIIVDGLRHQIQASSLFSTSQIGNFQEHITDRKHTLPFLLPDVPHLVQLMLTHAKKTTTLQLGKYLVDIDALGTEIRKPKAVQFIGARCPTYPPTRFFYVVLKMKFILEKKEKIVLYYERFEFL
jgi:hypothetical protein